MIGFDWIHNHWDKVDQAKALYLTQEKKRELLDQSGLLGRKSEISRMNQMK